MLRTVATSGWQVGLLVHVPVTASVVHDHRPLTIASAVRAGDARRSKPRTPPLALRQKSAPDVRVLQDSPVPEKVRRSLPLGLSDSPRAVLVVVVKRRRP